jgi:hypothetical protein
VNSETKTIIWHQFGAAIDMLENAIRACPEDVWGNRIASNEFWYVTFHSLFYLDLYLSESDKGFVPPVPFTLNELDERGLLPDHVYTKQELLKYLEHGREKCRSTIASLNKERANERCGFDWLNISVAEVLLYNMRHVQHHVGQLNLMLSKQFGSAPRWVKKTEHSMDSKE